MEWYVLIIHTVLFNAFISLVGVCMILTTHDLKMLLQYQIL